MATQKKEGIEEEWQSVDKTALLQDAVAKFGNADFVKAHPKRSCRLVVQLLYVLTCEDEKYLPAETTDLFFAVTKLFQSPNNKLRRLVYIFIKEIADTADSDEVIMVVSTLYKDINNTASPVRAHAFRVLLRIIDSKMLGQMSRHIKQAIVDANPSVVSAALVCGLKLMDDSPSVVRGWFHEIQDAISNANPMVQMLALGLFYLLKQGDDMGVSKMIENCAAKVRSPYAEVLLMRYVSEVLKKQPASAPSAMNEPLMRLAKSYLRSKPYSVRLEAAKACINNPHATSVELVESVDALQHLLRSNITIVQFATVRFLTEICSARTTLISSLNAELERLTSSSRALAVLATCTLLQTGHENGIDRLLRRISNLLPDIAEDFKLTIIRNMRELLFKFPNKHRQILGFLFGLLREEGKLALKQSVVSVLCEAVKNLPVARDTALDHICEAVEDCEFIPLSVSMVQLLAEEAVAHPDTAPRVVRYIKNRTILEPAPVRGAAVSCLGYIGEKLPGMRDSVRMMLQDGLLDEDDEVRDRALGCVKHLERLGKEVSLSSPDLPLPASQLRRALELYKHRPEEGPLTLDVLPHVEEEVAVAEGSTAKEEATGGAKEEKREATATSTPAFPVPEEFSSLGQLLRSCPTVALTEAELETLVHATKHVFKQHVVLELAVSSTLDSQCLRNVSATVTPVGESEDAWVHVKTIPAAEVRKGSPASVFSCFERVEEAALSSASFEVELHMEVQEIDPSTGEDNAEPFPDDYLVDELLLVSTDLIVPMYPQKPFSELWEGLGENEVKERFSLSFSDVPVAIAGVTKTLGMHKVSHTTQEAKNAHVLELAGRTVTGSIVLARCRLYREESDSVVLQIVIRAAEAEICSLVTEALLG